MTLRTHRTFSREFKLQVLREVDAGKPAAQVCRTHQIHSNCILKWRKQLAAYGDQAFAGNGKAVRSGCAELDYSLLAFVFMPEHVHLLVRPRQKAYDIGSFLQAIKQPVAIAAVRDAKHRGPESAEYKGMEYRAPCGRISLRFWQPGGGFDRNIFTSVELWQKIDYIHANPVTRQLCGHPADWRWSSAPSYYERSEGDLDIDLSDIPERT